MTHAGRTRKTAEFLLVCSTILFSTFFVFTNGGSTVEEHFPLEDKIFINDYTRNMLFCYSASTGEFVAEFEDASLRDSIYEQRHVDAPIGLTFIPGEKGKELIIVNENELLQYAFSIDKSTGPVFKLRNYYQLPSWGFAALTVTRALYPNQNLPIGKVPLASPFSWDHEAVSRLEKYSVLLSMPEEGHILRYHPDTHVHDVFSTRYSVRKYTAPDGNVKNEFIPTDMKFGPDGNLYVASRAKNGVVKLGGLTGHFMEVITKAEVPSPVGIEFLYLKSCKVPEYKQIFILFDLLVASSTDNCVYRFDGATGESKGYFVKPGDGGLQGPLGIGISPYDKQLYVASSKTGAILKYSNTTGDFISAFTPPRDRMVTPSYFRWGIDNSPPPTQECEYGEVLPSGTARKASRASMPRHPPPANPPPNENHHAATPPPPEGGGNAQESPSPDPKPVQVPVRRGPFGAGYAPGMDYEAATKYLKAQEPDHERRVL